jgi:hypothetical protein
MKDILVPISPGELLDKITILRIKSARMSDAAKVTNVRLELSLLEQTWKEAVGSADVGDDERALQAVNERLWAIEDDIRDRSRRRLSTPASSSSPAPSTSRTTSARPSRSAST